VQTELDCVAVLRLVGKLQLVGHVELGIELDGLDRRPFKRSASERSADSPIACTCSVG